VNVIAATILEVTEQSNGNLMLRLSDGRNYSADTSMTVRYCPVVGDYLVTQADGYEYLNPRDVFERKYSKIIPPHQQRVLDEKAELDDKLSKLSAFFSKATFEGLADDEQLRLRTQHVAMKTYSDILGERIAAF